MAKPYSKRTACFSASGYVAEYSFGIQWHSCFPADFVKDELVGYQLALAKIL